MTETVGQRDATVVATPAAVGSVRPARPGVPFLPAIFIAVALLVLGGAVMYWWAEREDSPGAVDIGFYDDMSSHHLQAIRMANLYQQHGEDDDMRARAEEIAFFQSGDVREMQNALTEWDETGTPDTAMEWIGESYPQDAQPGMSTPAEMEELAAARGAALDDLFTRLMIDHHAGGLHMAGYAADEARVGDVRTFAGRIARYQEREIDELNHARQDLGLPVYEPRAN